MGSAMTPSKATPMKSGGLGAHLSDKSIPSAFRSVQEVA